MPPTLSREPFTLRAQHCQLGIEPQHPTTPPASPIALVAFLSLERPQSFESFPHLARPSAQLPFTSPWREERRRYPSGVERLGLWCHAVRTAGTELHCWLWQRYFRELPLLLPIVLWLGLAVVWPMSVAWLVGQWMGSSGPTHFVLALLISPFTGFPIAYFDVLYNKRRGRLSLFFAYQTRLSRRREVEGGEMECDDMNEGGICAGWTVKSLSLAIVIALLAVFSTVGHVLNLSYHVLNLARGGVDVTGQALNTTGTSVNATHSVLFSSSGAVA